MQDLENIIAFAHALGSVQEAMRALSTRTTNGDHIKKVTVWLDFRSDTIGVSIHGFVDIEEMSGQCISHSVEIYGDGQAIVVEIETRAITDEGDKHVDGLEPIECRSVSELLNALKVAAAWFNEK